MLWVTCSAESPVIPLYGDHRHHIICPSVVIKLEGGTDSDLAVLDCPPSPPPERRRSSSNPVMSPQGDDTADSSVDSKKEGAAGAPADEKTPQSGKDSQKGRL